MPEFQRQQHALARAIRECAPLPGVEPRRLQLYQRLFYANVENFLATAFPVLRALSDDAVWHARSREFFARHRCREPQFYRIAEEFLRWLDTGRDPQHPDDPPFLRELCHYEWVELALAVQEAEDGGAGLPLGQDAQDASDAPLRLASLAWPLAYDWPVHRIGPSYRPASAPAQPTYLLVYRDAGEQVRFMELDASSARLLQLVEQEPAATASALLQRLAGELAHPQPAVVAAAGAQFLRGLRERGILRRR